MAKSNNLSVRSKIESSVDGVDSPNRGQPKRRGEIGNKLGKYDEGKDTMRGKRKGAMRKY